MGEDPHKHEGVVALFGLHVVKPGLVDSRYGRTLAVAKRLREDCDYDERRRATEDEARLAIADAQDFVARVEEVLNDFLAGLQQRSGDDG